MSTPIIVDLLIAAVLALNLFLGWSKGMVRGLLALAATILAIIAASQIGSIASDLLVEQVIRPATHEVITQHIAKWDVESLSAAPMDAITQAIEAIENDLVRKKAQELLSTVNLPTGEMTQDRALRISAELADTVLRGTVRDILSAVICVLCFALLSIAFRPIIWMIEQAFKLPLLKQLNQIGGLVSGAVKGVLLVLIAVWALRSIGAYLTDEVISASYLLKLCVQCLDAFGLGPAPVL
ncbi:MAG: CvpA family protein [Oscillospiraceae bacterium]|nr:CvpA family protein [Oscillospiraceae bacterium]